jgi:hypothetical protein
MPLLFLYQARKWIIFTSNIVIIIIHPLFEYIDSWWVKIKPRGCVFSFSRFLLHWWWWLLVSNLLHYIFESLRHLLLAHRSLYKRGGDWNASIWGFKLIRLIHLVIDLIRNFLYVGLQMICQQWQCEWHFLYLPPNFVCILVHLLPLRISLDSAVIVLRRNFNVAKTCEFFIGEVFVKFLLIVSCIVLVDLTKRVIVEILEIWIVALKNTDQSLLSSFLSSEFLLLQFLLLVVSLVIFICSRQLRCVDCFELLRLFE